MEQNKECKKCTTILILYFILSRIFFYLVGIRFDASPLSWFYQVLEPIDLKNDLFRSILYLHIQPPIFNFILGVILKLSSQNVEFMFCFIYSTMGLIMTFVLFKILIEMDTSPMISLLVCLFFTSSPPVILYENWLFYEYPVAFLLLISGYFLYLYIKNKKGFILFLFFLCVGLIILTRTIFHLLWFLGILIYLLFSLHKDYKKIILAGLIPFLFVFIFYLKNYLIFGQFTLSSWLGMNLIKMTWTIPADKISELVKEKKISDIAILLPFGKPEDYKKYANFDTITNIPVLDRKYRESGAINFNHTGYIKVSQEYYKTAKYLILKFPEYYLLSVAKAFYAYLKPCSDSTVIKGNNRSLINPWVHFYEYYLLGGFLINLWHKIYVNKFNQKDVIYINFLYIFIPIIYLWGLLLLLKGGDLLKTKKPQKILLIFIMFNIFYVTLIGNFTETGENMRFRFLILPYTYVLIGLQINFFAQKITKSTLHLFYR